MAKALGYGCRTVLEPRPWPLPGGCWELFCSCFSQNHKSLGLSQAPFLSIPIIFTGSVGPEHAGPIVGLLFLADSLGLVSPGPGVLVTKAGLVSYQLNPNHCVNAEQEDLLFLASGTCSKARVDFGHIQPLNTHVLQFCGSICPLGEQRV